MAVDMQKAEEYLRDLHRRFVDNPKALDSWVYQLMVKRQDALDRSGRVSADIQQMHNQITQAEARLRSLELQLQESQGRANGYTDLLIASEFDKAVPPEKKPEPKASDKKKTMKPALPGKEKAQ